MTDELAALEQRARSLHEQGDIGDEALAVNAAILALDPTNAAATNRRGVALTKRRELEDALAVFRDGVAANTSNQIAARRVREFERHVAKRAAALGEFVRRPPVDVVEPLLAGPGRAAALRRRAPDTLHGDYYSATDYAVEDEPAYVTEYVGLNEADRDRAVEFCPECGKRCRGQQALAQHIKAKHPGVK